MVNVRVNVFICQYPGDCLIGTLLATETISCVVCYSIK